MNRARATGKNVETQGCRRTRAADWRHRKIALRSLAEVRDAAAARIFDRLSAAEFGDKYVSHGKALAMTAEANALIKCVQLLADQNSGKQTVAK